MAILALAVGDSSKIFSFVFTLDCPTHVRQICETIRSRITFTYDIRHCENHCGDSYVFIIRKGYVFFCVSKVNTSRDIINMCVNEMKKYEITSQEETDAFLTKLLCQIISNDIDNTPNISTKYNSKSSIMYDVFLGLGYVITLFGFIAIMIKIFV